MRPPRKLDAEALWEYAVRLLGARAHAIGEVRVKLRARAQRLQDVDQVLARLKQAGYLNDQQFAESFAATRLETHRLGRTRVLHDLRARRVAPAVAEQTVDRIYRDVDERELIEDFLRRKLRIGERPGLLHDDKALASAFRRLMRAGFSRSTAVAVLKTHAANTEALEQMEGPDEDTAEEP
jgi:regulatory protein